MKKLIEIIKNRIFISIIGLIVLSLLIWFIGPFIKFGASNYAPLEGQVTRLVLIMVIVLLWGLNNLRIQMQGRKNNDELVNDLQNSPSGSQGGITSNQKSEEMLQIGERFSQALAILKKHKFKGLGLKRGLYELPWYIIIGPPGAGKTTALVNSSLDFPLAEQFGKGALRGVGGTRNCDWWFTNEAVLIDTAGRYTTQDSHKVVDSAAWDGFLELLRKHRRRRPINGAIVAISVQDLLTQTEEERLKHAKTIRTRIDELMDKMEIRFPIYLMFTKCDLISGFSEFFEDLTKDDREQVCGISLPNAPKPLQSPDFDFLEDEYRKLVKRLYERVIWRVQQERDVNRRGAIQGFPQQMENLQKMVLDFVQQTFIKNRYRYQPYLRGIYFTSGVQDGTPIDRLMSVVSANFGFDRQVVQTGMAQGKSYFLGQLFRSVIFPESELVGSNRRYESFIRWTQRASYVGITSLTVTMILVWAGAFIQNKSYLNEVSEYINKYTTESKRLNNWSEDLRTALPTLNALAKASVVYEKEAHPWLSNLGMYDGTVADAASEAYELQLRKLFLPRVIKYLEGNIKRGLASDDLYNNFRLYLMFNKPQYLDKKGISEWFATSWTKDFAGQATARDELKVHLEALLAQKPVAAPINQELVKSVRGILQRLPMPQRIYSQIRSDPKLAQKTNFADEIGGSLRTAYVMNEAVNQHLQIPLLFTKDGYDNVSFAPDSEVLARFSREKWVLYDDTPGSESIVKEDLKEISEKVKEYYMAEYKALWLNYYSSLNVKPFQNLQEANEVITSLTDPVQSPLLGILRVGAKNTQLTIQALTNAVDDAAGGGSGDSVKKKLTAFLASKIEFTPVDTQFSPINKLMRESASNPANPAAISGTIQKIQQLKEFLNEIVISPEPGKKAFEIAKARYQGGSGNAITALASYAKSPPLPDPLNRWLTTVSQETWKVILQSAHGYLSNEWRTQVYTPYMNGLANKYPLNNAARDEIATLDFIEFYKPGGTIDKFTTEFVKPFVDVGHGWTNRGIDNYSIGISAGGIAQMKKAADIKTVFFTENPAMPSLTFQLKPADMKRTDASFTLEVGDSRITYSHGPKLWETFKWAADDLHSRVRLNFEDLNEQQHSMTYEGPWAWFRLQDRSKLTPTSSNVYLVTYSVAEGNRSEQDTSAAASTANKHSIQYEIKAKSIHNPFNKDLLGSFRCPEGI
jgi:type VI secretion system protein ImpL